MRFCQFLLYHNVNRLCVYIYSLDLFPTSTPESQPSKSTQSTELSSLCQLYSRLPLAIWFTRGSVYMSRGASGKEPACQCRRCKRHRFDPWVREISWRRAWQPIPVFLPGEFHGQRSLVAYSPRDRKETDMTKRLTHTHTHTHTHTQGQKRILREIDI